MSRRAGIFIAIAGAVFMIFAMAGNPTDTVAKLEMMHRDMEVITRSEGSIVMQSHNAKYGSAYLYIGIDPATWTTSLADKYDRGLLALGWKEVSQGGSVFFCKEGVSANVQRSIEYGEGKGMYGINMIYNALTIRRCGKQ
jgi:hypothetical protein